MPGGAAPVVYALAAQIGGRVLIGGSFTKYGGAPAPNIARLDALGGLDSTVDPGGGPDAAVEAIAVQPDAKVLIGGGFSSDDGAPAPYLARLNADGTLDTSFDPRVAPDQPLVVVACQPDGKTVIAGPFATFFGRKES